MKRLLNATRLKGLELNNRAVLSPMTRVSAQADGTPNATMRDYYVDFAKGGFSLLITEGTYPDEAYGQGYDNQPGLANDAQRNGWKSIVDAVHAEGGKIFVQLMHGGAQTQGNRFRDETVAPSAIRPKGEQLGFYGGSGPYPTPREMSEEEIQEAIAGFANAARLAVEAGFDGIELHGANGYLIHEFLSAEFNRREDRWGGDLAARLALPQAIIHAVRETVGNDFIVGMRLSQIMVSDPSLTWEGGEEGARQRFRLLADAGLDFLHVSGQNFRDPAFSDGSQRFVALAREATDIALIVNGGIETGDDAEAALDDGADFVAIGKAALANRDWVKRVRHAQEMTPLDFDMLKPMATLDNEIDWREDNYVPARIL